MNTIIERVWKQSTMVTIEDLRGQTFQAESAGHTFVISAVDANEDPITLSGTPAGVMLRPDNTDQALTCSVSDGKVYATLPAGCYDVPGRAGITIFLTSDSQKTAIYAAIVSISRTSSGTVAPGTTASVVDLVNAINTAINSIPSSYSNLLADIAPNYSNTGLYSVGQYAWYDGDLKRCIVPITTAESYTAAHWTSAVLGQDISDVKSAFNTTLNPVSWTPTLKKGEYIKGADGTTASNNKYARTNAIQAGYKTRIAVVLANADYEFYISHYDSTGAFDGTGYIDYSGYCKGMAYIPAKAEKFGVTFRRVDQTNLSDSDINAINVALSAYAPTDKTMTVSGMAADAKATGDIKSKTAPEFDATATYNEGECVFYNGDLYRCRQAITTAGEWDANFWVSTTIQDEMKGITDKISEETYLDESELTAILFDWTKIGTTNMPLAWTRGYYNTSDGAVNQSSSDYMLRSTNQRLTNPDSVAFIVEPPAGYWVRVFRYDSNGTYLGYHSCTNRRILTTNGNGFKFTVGRFNDGSSADHITASFINQIKLTFLYKKDEQLIADNIIRVPVDIGDITMYASGIDATGGNYDTNNRQKCSWISIKERTYRASLNSNDYFIESCWLSDTNNSSTATILREVKPNNNTVVFTQTGTEKYFRMSFGRKDNAVMTNDDKTALASAISVYTLTDASNSIDGAIADAGELGKTIDIAKGSLKAVDYDWASKGTTTDPLGWLLGYYDADGAKQTSIYWIRSISKYVNMKEVVAFEVEPPEGYKIVVCEYTQDNVFVGKHQCEKKTLLPSNFNKYKFYVGKFDDGDAAEYLTAEFINQIKLTMYYLNVGTAKKLRTGEYEWFSINVERPLAFNGQETATTTQTIECVLRLPTSYSIAGEPTRLVLACHGASGYVDKANQTWYNSNWKNFMDALLDAGYAVFDSNVLPLSEGVSPNNIAGGANGSPLYVNVLKKAYDYIVENYNVKKQIFAHGTSMGGVGATAFSHAYPELVLAESSFAGRNVLRYLYGIKEGNITATFPKAYGYNDATELTNDCFSHVEGAFPDLSIIKYVNGVAQIPPDRATHYADWLAYYSEIANLGRNDDPGIWMGKRQVPYKAWNSWEDNEAYTKLHEVLQKIYNRGNACPYYVVNYESGTHTEMSHGMINNMIPQLINWYKRWDRATVVDDGNGD